MCDRRRTLEDPRGGGTCELSCQAGVVSETVVVRANDPRHLELKANGWRVTARSFGAQLDASALDQQRFEGLIHQASKVVSIRELDAGDMDKVLALDAATVGDYPGSIATQHRPLDRATATLSASRRAFGAFTPTGELVAMTFLSVNDNNAETGFTVVDPSLRGRGVASAVKAASVLALASAGIRMFRTGGSTDNVAILAANDALGYTRDEEWVTLEQSVP